MLSYTASFCCLTLVAASIAQGCSSSSEEKKAKSTVFHPVAVLQGNTLYVMTPEKGQLEVLGKNDSRYDYASDQEVLHVPFEKLILGAKTVSVRFEGSNPKEVKIDAKSMWNSTGNAAWILRSDLKNSGRLVGDPKAVSDVAYLARVPPVEEAARKRRPAGTRGAFSQTS